MSIYGGFSFNGKAGSLKEGVGILVQKRAKQSLSRYVSRLTHQMKKVALIWQNALRVSLSNPAVARERNTTLFPKMVTGKLRLSIAKPEVTIDTYGDSTDKIGNYKVKFTGLFERRGSNKHFDTLSKGPKRLNDVGEYLNNWEGKTFAGWKNRAQRNLLDAIKRQALEM